MAVRLPRVRIPPSPLILKNNGRGARVVKWAGLENRSIRKGTASSNLALSASWKKRSLVRPQSLSAHLAEELASRFSGKFQAVLNSIKPKAGFPHF